MVLSGLRRLLLEARRPAAWRKASRDWKRSHPLCAVCGLKKPVEAHDVTPYHLVVDADAKPYEFWIRNFITLCRHDHRRLAHCGDPQCLSYNPRIRSLAETVSQYKTYCTR